MTMAVRSNASAYALPRGFFPYWAALTVWPLLLVSLWRLEEPSKWSTALVLLCVHIASGAMIAAAKRAGIIESPVAWQLTFLAKLTLSVLILKYCWLLPVGAMARADDFYDSAAYDLYGKWLADENLSRSAFNNMTRGEFAGIVWYVGVVYKVFGVSTLYVALVNSLFSLLAFIALVGTLRLYDKSIGWQYLRFGMLFPELAYYDALPAKEPITVGLFCLGVYLLARVHRRGGAYASTIGWLVLTIMGLAFIRPAAFFVFVVFAVAFLVRSRRLRIRSVAVLSVAGGASFAAAKFTATTELGASLERIVSVNARMDLAAQAIEFNPSTDPDRHLVNQYLIPTSATDLILTAPIRIGLFMLGPYPKLIPNTRRFQDRDTATRYVVWLQEVFQKASALLIVLLMPAVASGLVRRAGDVRELRQLVGTALLVTSIMLAHAFFLPVLRFRTLVDPFLLSAAALGLRHGVPVGFALSWYTVAFAGLAAFYVAIALR